MAKYRKLPLVVEAVPYEPGTEDGYERVCAAQHSKYGCDLICENCPCYRPYIFDGYKRVYLEQGDYIVFEDGRKNIVKPDIFAATYEPADTPTELERLQQENERLTEACKAALEWHLNNEHDTLFGFGDDDRDEAVRKLLAALGAANV